MSMLTGYTFSEQLDLVADYCGATVSIEDVAGITYEIPCLRLRTDQYYHHCAYCENTKKISGFSRCVKSKQRSLDKVRKIKKAYTGYCPYGIWDLVYPVFHEERMMFCLYLGGLQKDKPLKKEASRENADTRVPLWSEKLEDMLYRYAAMLAAEAELMLYAWLKDGNKLDLADYSSGWQKEIHHYIFHNYREDICLAGLAEHLKLHPNYLGKLIKNSTGCSFRQLLQHYRISKARNLLVYPEYSISEIAYMVGFTDSNYFSSVFSKTVGMSPREFRKIKMRNTRES